MSLVSILTNLKSININMDNINNLTKINGKGNRIYDWHIVNTVLSDCAIKQYDMKRKYMNNNMLEKRHLADNVSGRELIDTLYQHIYMHNHIGMEDELYEVEDAIDKFIHIEAGSRDYDNRSLLAELLVLEEYIDVYHFVTELTSTLKEHYLMMLDSDKVSSSKNCLEYYFTGDNDFSNNVKTMLSEECAHLSSHLADRVYNYDMYRPKHITDFDIIEFTDFNTKIIKHMLKLNRNFIRECNFKDWKQYPEDYFSPVKMANLCNINRNMYTSVIFGISSCLKGLSSIIDYKIRETEGTDTFKCIYAVYNQKRDLNIKRQLSDPRYKINNIGSIIGDKV